MGLALACSVSSYTHSMYQEHSGWGLGTREEEGRRKVLGTGSVGGGGGHDWVLRTEAAESMLEDLSRRIMSAAFKYTR